jgi:hypothetical protein
VRGICPTILGETGNRGGGGIDDAVFPLVSMGRQTTHAKQLLIMDVIVIVFISRTIKISQIYANKRQIMPLGPKKIYKALVRRF